MATKQNAQRGKASFPRCAGFTMLELLITVVIIGILAAIAAPNFTRAVEKAKVKDVQGILATIASAEKVYRLDHSTYTGMATLAANQYLADPDAGNQNTDWNFGIVAAANTFTATATRTGGGSNGNTVIVNESFTGEDIAGAPYSGNTYAGNHPLRD
ncbi:MAG: prepilin-type N-terminal cleavage/methylation domain-containing protein [Candidatus Omnitrophica bacterium]|nr:prepilin-type N-terminal cleavage/methylation domain-containing protein [Candidatus Omnitrophota bacterium]